MSKLVSQSVQGDRLWRQWLHTGDDGRDCITTEIKQDVSPIIKATRINAQTKGKSFRFKANIPITMIDEASALSGKLWGISTREAFQEILSNKTDRSKRLLKTFTEGRDFRKLQAKHYV